MNDSQGTAVRAQGLRAAARRLSMLGRALPRVAVCVLMLGCGGSDGSGGAASSQANPGVARSGGASEATPGVARDACELIPAERIAAIVGRPVVARPERKQRESNCDYGNESGEIVYLGLTVYWEGGKEMLETVQTATSMAPRLMAEEPGDEALVDSIVRPGPVAGLGDVALFSDLMPSYVLSGDVLLEMYLQLLPNAQQHFRPLASTALARL